MNTPVEILQHDQEFSGLLDIYAAEAPRRVLEIGTHMGGSLYHWLQNAAPDAVVVAVDLNHPSRDMYPEWLPDGVTLHAIDGRSDDPAIVHAARLHGPFDWLFIDADHSYPAVKHDWETYWPLCKPGGIVAFHDILGPTMQHPEIQVSRLWKEIQRAGLLTRELVADPAAPWGGIGVVYLDA